MKSISYKLCDVIYVYNAASRNAAAVKDIIAAIADGSGLSPATPDPSNPSCSPLFPSRTRSQTQTSRGTSARPPALTHARAQRLSQGHNFARMARWRGGVGRQTASANAAAELSNHGCVSRRQRTLSWYFSKYGCSSACAAVMRFAGSKASVRRSRSMAMALACGKSFSNGTTGLCPIDLMYARALLLTICFISSCTSHHTRHTRTQEIKHCTGFFCWRKTTNSQWQCLHDI
jgi:hypothetical protein